MSTQQSNFIEDELRVRSITNNALQLAQLCADVMTQAEFDQLLDNQNGKKVEENKKVNIQ